MPSSQDVTYCIDMHQLRPLWQNDSGLLTLKPQPFLSVYWQCGLVILTKELLRSRLMSLKQQIIAVVLWQSGPDI
jgi:hypothetical protein